MKHVSTNFQLNFLFHHSIHYCFDFIPNFFVNVEAQVLFLDSPPWNGVETPKTVKVEYFFFPRYFFISSMYIYRYAHKSARHFSNQVFIPNLPEMIIQVFYCFSQIVFPTLLQCCGAWVWGRYLPPPLWAWDALFDQAKMQRLWAWKTFM
jgi:hypothetical protein